MSESASPGERDAFGPTYVAPLLGLLLVAGGIATGVLAGYATVQDELGLCGSPSVTVYSPADTRSLVSDPSVAVELDRVAFEELSAAERAAVREGTSSVDREGTIRGEAPHLEAFREGVLVRDGDADRYVTLLSEDTCLSVNPLLFPLGVVAILLGVGGVLTPPAYRKMRAFEERTR